MAMPAKLLILVLSNVIAHAYSNYLLDVYAPVDTEKISTQTFELDNVRYTRWVPKNNVELSGIVVSDIQIWKREADEKCASVLFAYRNNTPDVALLFLREGGNRSVKYCKAGYNVWTFVKRSEFVSLINDIKSTVKIGEVLTLDISKKQDKNKYSVVVRTKRPSNTRFSPRIGYRVTEIVDDGKPIWKAEAKGDRSICAWFYVALGRKLLLRNLVTYANGYSEFRVYVHMNGTWVYSKNLASRDSDDAVSEHGTGVHNDYATTRYSDDFEKNGITTPEDFAEPTTRYSDDFEKNGITTPEDCAEPTTRYSDDFEKNGITTPEDFAEFNVLATTRYSDDFERDGITTPEDFEDVRPELLPVDRFVPLDFSHRVDTSKCAVVKGKTNGAKVTLYYSRGFYFDNISKDGLVIWNSHSPFEGATCVSFYSKGKLQLADVLVVNPKNGDEFQYYVKKKTMWKPLSKHEFLSYLNGESKVEEDSAYIPFASGLVLMIACTLALI